MMPIPQKVEAVIPQIERLLNVKGNQKLSKVPVAEFIRLLYEHNGSAYAVAKEIGGDHSTVARRRKAIEEAGNIELPRSFRGAYAPTRRKEISLEDAEGTWLIGSDAHYWPDEGNRPITSTAHRAFIAINDMLKPRYVVLNGDGFDAVRISRHQRTGWEYRPKLKDELEATQNALHDIRTVNLNGKYIRTRGNHDNRFDTFLADRASDFEGIKGFSLSDHLPGWESCLSIYVPRLMMIKHRWHNGIHAARNNAQKAGLSVFTGHLHSLKCVPVTDYTGTRYGVDCGMLASKDGPQFDYHEDSPVDWRSGFVVATVSGGKLMPPETVEVVDEDEGVIFWRGQKWQV